MPETKRGSLAAEAAVKAVSKILSPPSAWTLCSRETRIPFCADPGCGFCRASMRSFPDCRFFSSTACAAEGAAAAKHSAGRRVISGCMQEQGEQVDGLCRFLCQHGWISDPLYAAFSRPMREECSKLRGYAISQLTAGSAMPPPILFEGDSGVGKSEMATRFANGSWRYGQECGAVRLSSG